MRVDIELSLEEEKRFEAIFEKIENQEIKDWTKKLWLRNRVMSGILSQELDFFQTDDLARIASHLPGSRIKGTSL